MPEPSPAREHATRRRIVDAAERLFALRGVGGVSLREIGTAAGQRNHSAVQYHFGSLSGLVDAVFAQRMPAVDARRRTMLDELDAAGRGDDLRGLVSVWVVPLADSIGPQTHLARFLHQVWFTDRVQGRALEDVSSTDTLQEVARRVQRVMRHLPVRLRTERIALAGHMLLGALAAHERAGSGQEPWRPVLVEDLVDAMVAVLEAPASSATRRAMRTATEGHPDTNGG